MKRFTKWLFGLFTPPEPNSKCHWCYGRGEFMGGDCIVCRGTGREYLRHKDPKIRT